MGRGRYRLSPVEPTRVPPATSANHSVKRAEVRQCLEVPFWEGVRSRLPYTKPIRVVFNDIADGIITLRIKAFATIVFCF